MTWSFANTNSTGSQAHQPKAEKGRGKLSSAFRRAGSYLRDQADQQSHSALYLSPQVHRSHVRVIDTEQIDPKQDQADLVAKLTALNGTTNPMSYWQNTTASSPAYTPSASSSPSMTSNHPDLKTTRHSYSLENHLQTYDVYIPHQSQSDYWLVYIHGGYFRDPKVDSTSLLPAIKLLENQVSGYASLNYRLSSHPAHPQNENTPPFEFNDAYWPDQPKDIISALQHLQSTFPDSKRYILAGHSVGATLAFIATLQASSRGIVPPAAVLGISGIYDFPAIHASNPGYDSLTKNAMPVDKYKEASPALYGADEYEKSWLKDRKVVLLAHSKDDELVVWDQVETMKKRLSESSKIETEVLEIHGKHNEIWEKGSELARSVQRILELLGKT